MIHIPDPPHTLNESECVTTVPDPLAAVALAYSTLWNEDGGFAASVRFSTVTHLQVDAATVKAAGSAVKVVELLSTTYSAT